MAELYRAGIIDQSGRFRTDLATPRLRLTDGKPEFVIAWPEETSLQGAITISQQDVRSVQLAKGALYAGAKLMMKRLGIEKLDRVVLAGAFGSYIDKTEAMILGMFPDCDLDCVSSVGNAAGDGARIALLNRDKRREAEEMARQVEYLELTLCQGVPGGVHGRHVHPPHDGRLPPSAAVRRHKPKDCLSRLKGSSG